MRNFKKLIIFFCFFNPFFVFAKNYESSILIEEDFNNFYAFKNQVKIYHSDDIKASNSINLVDFLNKHTNILASRQGDLGTNHSVRFRGLSSNYSLILVDGQKINSVSLGSADISFIDIDMVERIEIFNGSTSILFGDGAIGGVINIITKRRAYNNSNEKMNFIKLVYGNNGYLKNIISRTLTCSDLDINYNFTFNSYDGFLKNSDYLYGNIFFKINKDFDKNKSLEIRYINNKKESSSRGSEVYLTLKEKLDTEDNLLQLKYKINNPFGDIYFRTYLSIEEQKNYDDIKNDNFLNDRYGLEIRYSAQDKIKFFKDVLLGYNIEQEKAVGKFNFEEDYKYARCKNSFYLQKFFNYKNLENNLGLRYDITNKNYGKGFSYKFSSVYNFGKSDKNIFLNFGRTFRSLSFSEIHYTKKLKYDYEIGYGGDVGLEFLLCKNNEIVLKTLYFYQDINNKISWLDWQNPKQTEKTISNGVEINIDFITKKLLNFKHSFSYSYLDSKYKDKDTGLVFKETYIPYNSFNYMLKNRYKNFNFDIIFKYFGKQIWFDNYDNFYYLKSYNIVDFNSGINIRSFYFFFSINNIFKEHYVYRLNYPIRSREFYLGMRVSF